ncbi:hypothetical protein AALP_AA7G107900 [Arabis alpina]|uniref:AAA+ ATPase domain-containing protein n=1 Tax=Arabis alpina TaxID=50452 RepID=A0A087GH90_ARAAL|nr:hypothetical protein AALP_AA7G107900 [Arabis alpina]
MLGDKITKTASNIAGVFFFLNTLKRYFPRQLKITIQQLFFNAIQQLPFFKKCSDKILGLFSPYTQIRFREIEEYRYNYAYAAIKTYLGAKVNTEVKNLKGSQMKENMSLDLKRDDDKIEEEYEGVKMWWELLKCAKGKKVCRLTFHRSDWEVVTRSYLSYVVEEGKSIEARKKKIKLFMNNPSLNETKMKHLWSSFDFQHPATFETMAMDLEKKNEIVSDLLAFRDGKEYYNRIGKAWKRGYLLYGPPGTGKSTMIAAMANLMNYSIYDLELTSIENNWELKKLLIATKSKSIIVIEDIDCSLDLTGERKGKDESKRDDKEGKKSAILAKNYLNLDSHPLFGKIEALLDETKITPADVAENLMVKDRQTEVDGSLKGLIRTLEKMKWIQKTKAEE